MPDGGHGNLDELRRALRADADKVARALLGEPTSSKKNMLRWGSKGSLKLDLTGGKRGLWHNKESDEGGDLLRLIQQERRCNFADAVAWARNQTGLPEAQPDNEADRQRRAQQDADRRARQAEADARGRAEAEAERLSKIGWAQRIAGECVAADGTPAAWYLMQVRGIPRPAAGWPDAIGWHSGYRALVAVATRADGSIQCIQRVHLGADGGKVSAEEMAQRKLVAVKQTHGPMDGAVVRLPGDPSKPLLVAEGPETSLAAWSSTGFETWCALGGVGGVELPLGRRIVVVADDNPKSFDPKKGAAARALNKALAAWRQTGVDLVVATPWEARRRDKSDMADVVLAHGPDAVRQRIQAALQPRAVKVQRLPLADAERAVTKAQRPFFDRVNGISARRIEWDRKAAAAMQTNLQDGGEGAAPPASSPDAEPALIEFEGWAVASDALAKPLEPEIYTHGVRATVGLGKSRGTREEAARTLAAMRARGDTHNMVIGVPEHALGDEMAAAWQALPSVQAAGLRVAIWRGRGTPDPAVPGYADPDVPKSAKIKMCRDLERVGDVHSVGLPAQTAACKTTLKDSEGNRRTVACPLFDACAYQAQKEVKADLWLVAHSCLFHAKPAAIGEVAAVIVDEECWRTGLIGVEGDPLSLTLDALALGNTGALTGIDRERLRDLRKQLITALNGMADGPVQRDLLQHFSLTAASAAEGRALEWARKLDTKAIHPGLTTDERREAMETLEQNRTVARCAMMWNAVAALLADGGPAASGWVALGVEQTPNGPARVLRLKGRAEVAKGWKAPTLLLDALLPVELVRYYWPDVELVADVQAEMPHQHVYQVTDKAFALSMLAPLAPLAKEAAAADPEAAERRLKEIQRRQNRLRELRAVLVREAVRWAPGQVLVVAQKAVKEALMKLGGLPSNIALAHHNAIAGRDEWRNAAAVVVIGRTLPSPAVVECITEALTGEAVPALVGWFERADAVREMADGSVRQADADRHPHPIAEMVRWQIAEGQLVQIIGRGRGVRRTAANPVHVLALVDTPLPMPLAGVLTAADVELGPDGMMLAEGGAKFENARHAAIAYPSLWPSHQAAAKALDRGRSRTFPYYSNTSRGMSDSSEGWGGLVKVAYQVAGAGQKPVKAWAAPLLCADPAAFLAARLGKLAWCKVGDDLPPEPPAPEPPNPEPPPAPRPPPPSPAADDDDGVDDLPPPEPPRGHPAWDVPPVEEPDGRYELADWDDAEPAGAFWDVPTPQTPFMVCDVPALHPAIPAYVAADGGTVLVCPYCGQLHHHGGFGHRLAHCADPGGRGYELVEVAAVPPWTLSHAPAAALGRELRQ